jgi:hypothetical protein
MSIMFSFLRFVFYQWNWMYNNPTMHILPEFFVWWITSDNFVPSWDSSYYQLMMT